jgi:hypothetical protein
MMIIGGVEMGSMNAVAKIICFLSLLDIVSNSFDLPVHETVLLSIDLRRMLRSD